MLNHVHLARFSDHAPSLAGRIDATSLRALQHMAAPAQGRAAEEVEDNLCLLLDRARFHPGIELFVFLTPHAPARTLAACLSDVEARGSALSHLRKTLTDHPAKGLAGQMRLRFEPVPEPVFAALLPEMPPIEDEEPVGAL